MRKLFIFLFALSLITVCFSPVFTERGSVIIIDEVMEDDDGILPLSGFKIGIDPGHQLHGDNTKEPIAPGSKEMKARVASGTSGVETHIPEHVTNLEIALQLKELLIEMGAEVLMTRETDDVNISNMERAIMMNDWGADAVVRLHCDGSTDHSLHGMAMYIRKTGEGAEESERLARALLGSMSQSTGAKANGVYKRNTYTGLNWSTVPCVLVEMGYMTNPAEDKKLNDPGYQRLLVEGIAKGLAEYLTAE